MGLIVYCEPNLRVLCHDYLLSPYCSLLYIYPQSVYGTEFTVNTHRWAGVSIHTDTFTDAQVDRQIEMQIKKERVNTYTVY